MSPGIPTGVIATSGDTSVTIGWTAVAGALRYSVKRSAVSGGPYTTIATQVSSPPYTDTGLTNGTPYYYVLSASSPGGEGERSAEASAHAASGEQRA
jgi:mannan endo-1,4-beta-mannosidase